MKKTIKLLSIFSVVLLVFCVLTDFGVIELPSALSAFLLGSSKVCLAMSAGIAIPDAVSIQKIQEESPGLTKEYINEKVTEIAPSKFRFDTMLRGKMKQKRVDSMEVKDYSVRSIPTLDTIDDSKPNPSYTYSSGDGIPELTIPVKAKYLWGAKDTFLVRELDVVLDATGKPVLGVVASAPIKGKMDLIFFVESIDKNASTLTVRPLGGIRGTGVNANLFVMPDIKATDILHRASTARNEMDSQTHVVNPIPSPDVNYCQYRMAQVESGDLEETEAKEVKWTIGEMSKLSIMDMKYRGEVTDLYGSEAMRFNTFVEGEQIYAQKGIIPTIQNQYLYGNGGADTTITDDMLVDISEQSFTGSNGSDSKLLMGDAKFMANLSKNRNIQKQLAANNTEVHLGVTFRKFTTNFGEFLISPLDSMTVSGSKNQGIVLDMEFVSARIREELNIVKIPKDKHGEKRSTAYVLREIKSVVVTNPDVHMKLSPRA